MALDKSRTHIGTRRLFVSYTREDRQHLQSLLTGLDRLHYTVWVDQRLTGGQTWWDEILRQIALCDAVIVAVSPGLAESEAAAAERQYATALGKPILPVIIRPMLADLLPPDLAVVHYVDYSSPDTTAAFALADALGKLPPAPPLPETMPEPPPVPKSYVSDLADRVRAPSLTLDEQVLLVDRLRTAMQRSSQRDAARQVLLTLRQRDDLFHTAARQIEELLQSDFPEEAQPVPRDNAVVKTSEPGRDVPPPPPALGTGQKPVAHWTIAIISTLLAPPIGMVAIYYAAQVGARWQGGDATGAKKASNLALVIAIIGIVFGGLYWGGAFEQNYGY